MKVKNKGVKVVIDERSAVTVLAIKKIIATLASQCQFFTPMTSMHDVVSAVEDISAELLITDLACDTASTEAKIMQIYQLCQRQSQLRVIIYSHPLRGAEVTLLSRLPQVSFVLRSSPLQEFELAVSAMIFGGEYVRNRLQQQEEFDFDKTTEKLNLLTNCEKDVLAHLLHGKTLSDISSLYCRSIKTISAHKCNAMRKLEAKNVADLFLIKNDFFRALNF